MNTKEAMARRIIELCEQRNLAVNALANISEVSPSTIYSTSPNQHKTKRAGTTPAPTQQYTKKPEKTKKFECS